MRSLLLVLSLSLPFAASACDAARGGTAHAQDQRVYECPMHCKLPGHSEPYTQRGPGDCPVCGMHLVPQPSPRH